MNEEKPPVEVQQCPAQMPVSYFGAHYQDSQCIDGYLWDEDSGDGEYLASGGDIPCPFCKPVEHTQYQLNNDGDMVVCEKCETTLTQLHWAETNKPSVKLYGFCESCNCNQWATVKEEQE
jgi:hypothetical protein